MQYLAFFFFAVAAMIVGAFSRPSPTISAPVNVTTGGETAIMSDEQLDLWLATTDAELIFVGEDAASNPLSRRSAQTTKIIYCSSRAGNVCGGVCTVYNGGPACIDAPKTMCMSATKNIGYCDKTACSGSCNSLASCGTFLDGGFCLTANTNSIVVSNL